MRNAAYALLLIGLISFALPARAKQGDMFGSDSYITYDPPAWVPGARAHEHSDVFGPPQTYVYSQNDMFRNGETPPVYGSKDMFTSRLQYVPDNKLYNWPKGQSYP